MGLVGVGAFVLFAVMSLSLVVLGAGGEVLMLAFAFVAVLSSIALDEVIKHYVARDERREREMTLKLR